MTMVLAILIFFIKKKREINFEIYHENKKLVKYIQLKLKYNYKLSAVLSKNDSFLMEGTIKYRFFVCERGKLPSHLHQIGQYMIDPLKFPSLRNETIISNTINAKVSIKKNIKKESKEKTKEKKRNEEAEIIDNE